MDIEQPVNPQQPQSSRRDAWTSFSKFEKEVLHLGEVVVSSLELGLGCCSALPQSTRKQNSAFSSMKTEMIRLGGLALHEFRPQANSDDHHRTSYGQQDRPQPQAFIISFNAKLQLIHRGLKGPQGN